MRQSTSTKVFTSRTSSHSTLRFRHKATATIVQFQTALIKEHISIFRAIDATALVHNNSAAMSTFEEVTRTGDSHRRRDGKLVNAETSATIYTR